MYTLVFGSSIRLCLQTKLLLSWKRDVMENIDPSPRTLIMYVSCKNDFVGDNDCVGDNVGMGYDCSHDLLFDCE